MREFRPIVEALERRLLLSSDLPVLDIGVDFADFTIGNDPHNVSAVLRVSNYSQVARVGAVRFRVYASATGDLDAGAILLRSFTRAVNIDPSGDDPSQEFPASFSLPRGLYGDYFLLVQAVPVGGEDAAPWDNVAQSPAPVTLEDPYVNVALGVAGAPAILERTVTLRLELDNLSTVARVGRVNYKVYALAADGDERGVLVYSFSRAAPLPDADGNAGAEVFDVRFTLPASLSDGDYGFRVEATPAAGIDIDLADNVAWTDCVTLARPYLDVAVEFADSPAVVGRQVSVPVWLYNFSTAARAGKVSLKVFAVPADSPDDPGIAVYSFSLPAPAADGGATQADIRFTLPAGLSDGCYVLRVEARPAADDANPADNVALSGLFWLDAPSADVGGRAPNSAAGDSAREAAFAVGPAPSALDGGLGAGLAGEAGLLDAFDRLAGRDEPATDAFLTLWPDYAFAGGPLSESGAPVPVLACAPAALWPDAPADPPADAAPFAAIASDALLSAGEAFDALAQTWSRLV